MHSTRLQVVSFLLHRRSRTASIVLSAAGVLCMGLTGCGIGAVPIAHTTITPTSTSTATTTTSPTTTASGSTGSTGTTGSSTTVNVSAAEQWRDQTLYKRVLLEKYHRDSGKTLHFTAETDKTLF